MHRVFLGLGSNIGNRLNYISNAVSEIKNNGKNSLIKLSSLYETEPWGKKQQNLFINIVIEISTSLSPDELLLLIKDTEKKLGRAVRSKWSEREIDVDILFYDDLVIKKKGLEIPHPEIQNRNFVLIPLNEIAPDFIHPILKKKISVLFLLSPDKLKCNKIG
ncbi:MAG: 2-amino-4-hydroxy-6-hydroxymethyldihydropteridine diphosphokinase [Ignavibacteria bacterium]|nr:2-amino-4-hydroxy-6-hydroxymethyldihydropteridine diphosphokinase [Ignavibacteria bacterium]